jgi:hypothetical protein
MKNLKNAENACLRGVILKILEVEFPSPVDFKVLRLLLSLPVPAKKLAGCLGYLENAEYAEINRDNEENIITTRLTNKGLNLLEGFISDCGIKL